MKSYPQEKILKNDTLIFAKWKTSVISSKQFVLMEANAFVIVTKGKKVTFDGNQTIEVNNKQLLILRKGLHKMTEYLAEDGFFEAIVIYFTDTFFQQLHLFDAKLSLQNDIIGRDLLILNRDRLIDSFVVQYISYIEENESNQSLLELKITELIYILSSKYPEAKLFFQSIGNKENGLRNLMEKLYKENYTINELAQLSNRSISTFKRDFKRVFQCSPAKWIIERKLSEACVLLRTTTMSISDIAFECGFESLSQFDKSFKKHFDQTPSSLRKNIMG